MKLSGLVKAVASHVVSVSFQPPIKDAKPIVWRNPRFQDGMDAPRPAPKVPGVDNSRPPQESNPDYVTRLYRELLGREPDAEGFRAHLAGLAGGTSREQLKRVFLESEEYRQLHAPKPPPEIEKPVEPQKPQPPPVRLVEPGAPLQTVPLEQKYVDMAKAIDRSSVPAAVKSAAAWVKDHHPHLFEHDDRQVAFEIMTWVIGGLRVAGYDAHRVVNHPTHPIGNGWRYGSDALVLGGDIYDVYVAFGSPATQPAAQNVGPYAPGRLRE